jgi:hypothetical protein
VDSAEMAARLKKALTGSVYEINEKTIRNFHLSITSHILAKLPQTFSGVQPFIFFPFGLLTPTAENAAP